VAACSSTSSANATTTQNVARNNRENKFAAVLEVQITFRIRQVDIKRCTEKVEDEKT
jgi:hypothetical protein